MKRIAREVPQIPLWSKVGFIVILLGLAADVFTHLTAGIDRDHAGASTPELSAHLVVFIGMVVVLVGVLVDGLHGGHGVEAVTNSKETI